MPLKVELQRSNSMMRRDSLVSVMGLLFRIAVSNILMGAIAGLSISFYCASRASSAYYRARISLSLSKAGKSSVLVR